MYTPTFGILTISDTCHKNKEKDRSGPALIDLVTTQDVKTQILPIGKIMCTDIIPDDQPTIEKTLIKWSDDVGVNVILTTGGTGFSNRDVTPEATKNVIDKEAPGIAHAMMLTSLNVTPMAALSRAIAGIRKKTLIINLPGSPKAAKECFMAIAPALPHAVDLLIGNDKSIAQSHQLMNPTNIHQHSCPHSGGNISLNLDKVAHRHRESPFPMISLIEAQSIIESTTDFIPTVDHVKIWYSLGRILAKDITSPCDLPPFRASIKDGYAVIASDGKGKRKVLGGLEAGKDATSLKILPGTCMRINTGAPLPEGATAVIQVEDTKLLESSSDGKEEKFIEILSEPKDGQDIRPIGSDMRKGDLVLKEGTKIGAIEASILASCGLAKLLVRKIPRIGVLSTGNELQNAGEPAKPGHIYDSNKIALISMLKENGYEADDLGIVKDRESDMIINITSAMKSVDVIITTGSVSMGDRDMLKPVLKGYFGATIHFGRVNMKPGKPTTYATCNFEGVKKYFLCLPGNPVSAVVTANLFVFPLLNRLTGNNEKPVVVSAKLTSTYNLDPRPEFARVVLEWSSDDAYPKAYSTGNQISSKLLSCKNANALLMLPARTNEQISLSEGDIVPAMLLGFNQRAG